MLKFQLAPIDTKFNDCDRAKVCDAPVKICADRSKLKLERSDWLEFRPISTLKFQVAPIDMKFDGCDRDKVSYV